uniref:Uncharacterized protein n=1 Tax=Anguilla anguilla TaxID=7936 RepID=A0A0E9QI52_ANGAN
MVDQSLPSDSKCFASLKSHIKGQTVFLSLCVK